MATVDFVLDPGFATTAYTAYLGGVAVVNTTVRFEDVFNVEAIDFGPPDVKPAKPKSPRPQFFEHYYARRVGYWVEELDRRFPGWYLRVNLETLNVASCSECVLAQVFLTYFGSFGVSPLDENGFQYEEVAINSSPCWLASSRYGLDPERGYKILTQLWRKAIERRRETITMTDVRLNREYVQKRINDGYPGPTYIYTPTFFSRVSARVSGLARRPARDRGPSNRHVATQGSVVAAGYAVGAVGGHDG